MQKLALDEMLANLRESRDYLPEIIRSLPADLADFIRSPDFGRRCAESFVQMDVDGNGALDPGELFPVIAELAAQTAHPLNIDEVHCRTFLDIFDKDGNGLITRDEFFDFASFITAITYLEQEQEELRRNADPGARVGVLEAENSRLREALDTANQRNLELERQLRLVTAGALKSSQEELLRERKLRERVQLEYKGMVQEYSRVCGMMGLQKATLDKLTGPKITTLPPLRKTRSMGRIFGIRGSDQVVTVEGQVARKSALRMY